MSFYLAITSTKKKKKNRVISERNLSLLQSVSFRSLKIFRKNCAQSLNGLNFNHFNSYWLTFFPISDSKRKTELQFLFLQIHTTDYTFLAICNNPNLHCIE